MLRKRSLGHPYRCLEGRGDPGAQMSLTSHEGALFLRENKNPESRLWDLVLKTCGKAKLFSFLLFGVIGYVHASCSAPHGGLSLRF